MLAPIFESSGDGPFFRLGVRSLERFPSLVTELRELSGIDPQYVQSGVLRVASGEREANELRERVERLTGHGLEWLSPEAARQREPLLTASLHGALWSPREGHVYSPALARAYASAAARLGARIETGVTVLGLQQAGGRVTGVRTATGDRAAGQVVLCAGVWSRFCAEWLNVCLPVQPVRGQILALDAPRPTLRSIVWGDGAYLVPKLNGSVVVGATEEQAGFDCRVTAGGVASLLRAAPRYVPALSECGFRAAWAGLRPDTPDHLPVLGPVSGVEGIHLAAGHYRNGVLLSPATGELLTAMLTRGERPAQCAPFLPDRFLTRTNH
jgi:glycine oxidase